MVKLNQFLPQTVEYVEPLQPKVDELVPAKQRYKLGRQSTKSISFNDLPVKIESGEVQPVILTPKNNKGSEILAKRDIKVSKISIPKVTISPSQTGDQSLQPMALRSPQSRGSGNLNA